MWRQIAGWVGLWVGLAAFYAATAILTAEVWEREWLPIGHMLKRGTSQKTCAAACCHESHGSCTLLLCAPT